MTGCHHHGQKQGRQRRRIGHSRAGQRRHDHGGHDGHITQTAFDVAHAGHRKVHDSARQTACVHDLAGQHEKRHSQQRETVGPFEQVLREDLGIKHVQVPHQRHAANQ